MKKTIFITCKFQRKNIRIININQTPWFILSDIKKVILINDTINTLQNIDKFNLINVEINGEKNSAISLVGLVLFITKYESELISKFLKWLSRSFLPVFIHQASVNSLSEEDKEILLKGKVNLIVSKRCKNLTTERNLFRNDLTSEVNDVDGFLQKMKKLNQY